MTSIGVVVATRPAAGGWSQVGAVARSAETAGLDRIWFTDHLFWYRSAPDALMAAALAGAATTALGVGALVLQLPLHHTASIAKSASFLDEVTNGRVILGVGVGEHRWEYERAGVADRFPRRGRLLDEAITELRAHWSGAGEPPMAPVRDLPIWIGGRSAAARQRAAALGDGWIPHLCSAEWFAEQADRFRSELAEHRRNAALGVSLLVHVDGIDDDRSPLEWAGELYDLPPDAFGRVLIRGRADEVAEALSPYIASEASHIALFPASDRPVEHAAAIAAALRS